MSKALAAALAIVFLAPGGPAAHAQAPLAWKLRKGDRFTLSITTEAKDVMTIARQSEENRMKLGLGFDVTVREAPRGGDLTLGLRITSFTAEGSRNADAVKKIGGYFKGAEISATVDRAMKLQRLAGVEALIRKIAEADGTPPAGVEPVEKIFTIMFRYLLEEAFVAVPGRATKRGETWGQTTHLDFVGMGTIVTKKTFTDEGPASVGGREVRKVGVKATLSFAPPKKAGGGLFPGTIDKFDIKNQTFKGSLSFDPVAGRPAAMDTRYSADIALTLTVDGMSVEAEGTREQSFRIRFGAAKSE
jgi:hypothetical protein